MLESPCYADDRAHSSAAERPAHNRLVLGSNPGGPMCRQDLARAGSRSVLGSLAWAE